MVGVEIVENTGLPGGMDEAVEEWEAGWYWCIGEEFE